jgi:hypothetical protein
VRERAFPRRRRPQDLQRQLHQRPWERARQHHRPQRAREEYLEVAVARAFFWGGGGLKVSLMLGR